MLRFWRAMTARNQVPQIDPVAGRGNGMVTVRLNQWALGALDESSSRWGVTPSDVMNRALVVYDELRRTASKADGKTRSATVICNGEELWVGFL